MDKRLLMLNADESEVPFILAARSLGYYVITSGNHPNAFGHRYADEYIPCDYSDRDRMLEMVKTWNIDAICQGCSDYCAMLAAFLGEKLGLPGHDTYANTEIIHRKDAFKRFTGEYNIKSPVSKGFTSLEDALAYGKEVMFPVIVKPTDLAGGIGVSVARDSNDYEQSVQEAYKRSRSGHIVVESYIEGTLHSLCTFIVNQKVVAYGTANDYSYMNKFRTNTGLFPADNWQKAVEVLIPETEKVASILGLVDGQLHMQYMMTADGEPWIIEMMRRSPGNHFTGALTNSIGINWREWVIRAEAGENCAGIPSSRIPEKYYGYHSIMSPRNGVFKELVIDPEFRKQVFQVEQWKESGFEFNDYMGDKFGSVQYFFNDDEERERFLPRINELARIEYQG